MPRETQAPKDLNAGLVRLKLAEFVTEYGVRPLAREAGISPTTVMKYAYDPEVQMVSLKVLAQLCAVLGCEIGDLVEYTPPEALDSFEEEGEENERA